MAGGPDGPQPPFPRPWWGPRGRGGARVAREDHGPRQLSRWLALAVTAAGRAGDGPASQVAAVCMRQVPPSVWLFLFRQRRCRRPWTRSGLTRPSSSVAGEGRVGSLHAGFWQLAHRQPLTCRTSELERWPLHLPRPFLPRVCGQAVCSQQRGLSGPCEGSRQAVGWPRAAHPLQADWMGVLA